MNYDDKKIAGYSVFIACVNDQNSSLLKRHTAMLIHKEIQTKLATIGIIVDNCWYNATGMKSALERLIGRKSKRKGKAIIKIC